MFILRKSNRKVSARQQINIKGAKDGVLMLSGDQYRIAIEVSSVNFELKSDDEQDALIDTYESFLNALPCPIQIVVRIRELDMDKYLADIQGRLDDEKEEIYQSQISNYAEFVKGLVADNKILSRHFYIVLPFAGSDGGVAAAKEQLTFHADMVCKGLTRLGMQTRQLESLELLDLFHTFYNPSQAKRQPFSEQVVRVLSSTYVRKEPA